MQLIFLSLFSTVCDDVKGADEQCAKVEEEVCGHGDDAAAGEADKDEADNMEEDRLNEDGTGEKDELKEQKRKIGCNNDEVLAVLAHELGHWKLSHNLKNLVIGQVIIIIIRFV